MPMILVCPKCGYDHCICKFHDAFLAYSGFTGHEMIDKYHVALKERDEAREYCRQFYADWAKAERELKRVTQMYECQADVTMRVEEQRQELEGALEEIRDLARTGTSPDAYGMTSLEEWEHYKINRIAGMANTALNK